MRKVYVLGAGMTRFGKFLDRSMKDLAGEAVRAALDDAGLALSDLQAAFVGNATQGLITGQEMVRGQVVLRELGLGGIPIVNVENACASSSTALNLGWQGVAGGFYDCALVLGMEKLYHEDKKRSFAALGAAVDVELIAALKEMMASEAGGGKGEAEGAGTKRSMFMDFYAMAARQHMQRYGTTKEQFAKIAAKNSFHGSLNPKAQYQEEKSVADVLASPVVAEPLHRLMCSPIGDGAAAMVLVSEDFLAALERRNHVHPKPVGIRASVLLSGFDRSFDEPDPVARAAKMAYERAGIGPDDIDLAEVHDASAPAELMIYEELGFCPPGEGGRLVDEGVTRLGGSKPVNTSGGLIAKGHPVGATGAAQVCEIVEQLRGVAGKRQVSGAKVGLTENAGGVVRAEPAAVAVHILAV